MRYSTKQQKQAGDAMNSKKDNTRFSLQFNKEDPNHLKVAEILNQQSPRRKAQYIVSAVIHYINCDHSSQAALDIKTIEDVVNRLLQNRDIKVIDKSDTTDPVINKNQTSPILAEDEINLNDALEELDAEGFKSIVGTLDLFRKKI